jgi:hypothetical protein
MSDEATALEKLGFEGRAIDGRAENVEQARRGVPSLDIHVAGGSDAKFGFLVCTR